MNSSRMSDPKFMSRFQIGDTGISQDYFNDILVLDTCILLEPQRYYKRGEVELKERLVVKLGELRNYTKYIEDVVTRCNEPSRCYDGTLVYTRPEEMVHREDFINEENLIRVKTLDGIAESMKELGTSVEKIELQVLMNLMYQASLLIYGPGREERLKKRFHINQA